MGFVKVAETSEIPVGGQKVVTIQGKEILITNIGGNYYAMGNRHRTVNLDSNYDLTIEYTDADENTGRPLSILPQWDLTSEQGILFTAIPVGAVVLYAGSIALRSKRKWKYSYL